MVLQHHRGPRREQHGTGGDEGSPAQRYAAELASSISRAKLSFTYSVEGRLYTESMTLGATTKSNPSANKIDETELERLREKDYWLIVTRNKLLLDLIFVCESLGPGPCLTGQLISVQHSIVST